ncbi:class I SAM-dependent methyltransferase [Phaeacidiphilus oryzae]|jgi:SAM-dependent methyltransferase|uniref:class I SAM-dependent methyltransferase n=1 Tax=Phaeacidiphilus oryzae TaxID=348818 RepID=UPI000560D8B9|nr:class I SAM-dependent methyltransferase [Phaeacidiphilus oryzae]
MTGTNDAAQRRKQRSGSFGEVAGEYGRLRPAPCPAAVDWALPDRPGARVLDLAAGAGTLTAELAARGLDVVAVEPDDRMRAVLEQRNPAVPALAGTAEGIPLPDGGLDGVLVSAAWHWFDANRAVPEISRVLRPGGRLGVLWNGLDTGVDWVGEWHALTRRRDFDATDGAGPADSSLHGAPHRHMVARGELLKRQLGSGDGPFVDLEHASFGCSRRYSPADAAALLGTYSRVIMLPPEDRAELLAEAREWLCGRFGLAPEQPGVELPFRSHCWRAVNRG